MGMYSELDFLAETFLQSLVMFQTKQAIGCLIFKITQDEKKTEKKNSNLHSQLSLKRELFVPLGCYFFITCLVPRFYSYNHDARS